MAEITVRGGSKSQKKYAKSIAEFTLSKIMTNRLSNSLKIDIQLVRDLKNREGVHGDAITMDEFKRPKMFHVRADSTDRLRSMLTTIAHELVHVKQWATGEMYEYSRAYNITRWKKKKINTERVDYWDYPWEIEAHGRELGLFIRWCEANDLGKYKWTHDPD